MPTNEERADLAQAAVNTFAELTGCESTEEVLVDLLANLMHLCKREEIDFDACLSMATDHFAEEM